MKYLVCKRCKRKWNVSELVERPAGVQDDGQYLCPMFYCTPRKDSLTEEEYRKYREALCRE